MKPQKVQNKINARTRLLQIDQTICISGGCKPSYPKLCVIFPMLFILFLLIILSQVVSFIIVQSFYPKFCYSPKLFYYVMHNIPVYQLIQRCFILPHVVHFISAYHLIPSCVILPMVFIQFLLIILSQLVLFSLCYSYYP